MFIRPAVLKRVLYANKSYDICLSTVLLSVK